MDFYEFLRQFIAGDIPSVALVAVIVGGAAYAIVQGIDAIIKNSGQPLGLSPDLKYWSAVALCVVIPLVAYVLVTANDSRPLTFGGVVLAAGVAFTAATTIHWVTGGSNNAKVAQIMTAEAKAQGKRLPKP